MYISSNLTISTHPRYAGGLGPQNLTKQIHKMKAAAPDRTVWCDMESSLRTLVRKDDEEHDVFDMNKVMVCIQQVSLAGRAFMQVGNIVRYTAILKTMVIAYLLSNAVRVLSVVSLFAGGSNGARTCTGTCSIGVVAL
jgi:hypothetical protein